jgi:serine/threonine protein kinase
MQSLCWRERITHKVDVWSVGVITFQLLFGRLPLELEVRGLVH